MTSEFAMNLHSLDVVGINREFAKRHVDPLQNLMTCTHVTAQVWS